MVGLIGKKVGMTQIFDEDGLLLPVTLVKIDPNIIVGKRTLKKNRYDALILGAFPAKQKAIQKPYVGQFPENIEPTKLLKEFQDFGGEYQIGDTVGVELFEKTTFVDVKGTTKGKGFQGVMKRHGFSGGEKTHGSKFHRAGGSTGQAAWPSRVFRGTKMAGRMGGEQRRLQNLQVVQINQEDGFILIKGAVPGRKNSTVLVTKSRKRK